MVVFVNATPSIPELPRDAAILSLRKFCRDAGISDPTAWRWRRRGMLRTVNIAGRVYLTRGVLEEFLTRVEAGEFAVQSKVPTKLTGPV
jgi:hypothetical protein